MDLTTNIIKNVYNIGTNSCDAGTQYCADGYALYFPCLKDITKGQAACFDFYVADYAGKEAADQAKSLNPDSGDDSGKELVDLRKVDALSLNLNGQFNCSYGTFSYPDNIFSLQMEKYPVVYRYDFGERKLCHLNLFMVDIENSDSDAYGNFQESDFYSGTEVEVAAYDTPTHIFVGWAILTSDDEDCPEETWDDYIVGRSNTYKFIITEDITLLALYRPRKRYSIVSDPTNKFSHFNVDYNHIVYHISNRDEEIFDDDYDVLNDALEGYHMVAKCMPSTDVIGDGEDMTYEFVEWKDQDKSRCRLFKIGKDTTRFEEGNIIKLKAVCSGPVPYYEQEDEEIFYIDEFDEEGIHILTEFNEISISDFYPDGEHVKSAEEAYQKFIRETGYLYLHSGRIVLSSEGIEDGIKINIYAKADEFCVLNIIVNGYTVNQAIATDEFKLYEFYFSKCDKSDIEIIIQGECLIDDIEICKEEIIDKGKAEFCLDAEDTAKLPSGPLSVDGAIMVEGQAYGLAPVNIGQVNRLPQISIKTN